MTDEGVPAVFVVDEVAAVLAVVPGGARRSKTGRLTTRAKAAGTRRSPGTFDPGMPTSRISRSGRVATALPTASTPFSASPQTMNP
jgi:hypothetical protein